MNILALDLATVTGWAYGTPGGKPSFGQIRFMPVGGVRAVAYRTFRDWLEQKWNVRGKQPDVLVYESPLVPTLFGGRTNIDTTRLLFGLAEHLEEWALGRVELREANIAQVRGHFIGRSNLKSVIAKQMTKERCLDLGWPVQSTDQADACALWDFQCSALSPEHAAHTTELFAP